MGNNSISITDYKNAISEFEQFLNNIYSKKNTIGMEYTGYLINLKDYEKIKEIINSEKININNSENTFKINQIEFKTPQYLINMVLNGNKYIIIKPELWELICDKDKKYDSSIIYKVNSKDITFSLDNKELSFKHNKNIIDKNAFKNSSNYSNQSIYESNYEKIKKICESVINYYNFENEIQDDLTNKQNYTITSSEFLVSKEWIDKWKKYSNYDDIKTKYLQNNINKKEDILIVLIYYLEQEKINFNELPISINNKNFSKKEDLENILESDSLVLVNSKFLYCFNNYSSEKFIKYNAFNNKIHIYFDKDELLSFKTNDNIISLNGIIKYSIHLKQLIKIFYYQKKLRSNFKEKEAKNKMYLIHKNVITKYKNNFDYRKLDEFLKSNLFAKSVNYNNLDNYYYKILNELDNDYIALCNNKNLTEFKNIEEKFIESEYKINSPLEKCLKYITNFEIVDNDIKDFFIKNEIAKEDHFISLNSYKSENEKSLLIFEKSHNNFFEIGHFNDNEDFIIEYLIDELEKDNNNCIKDFFFSYIIKSWFRNDSKDNQNIINLDHQNQKVCYYYKIEEKKKPEEIKDNSNLTSYIINNYVDNLDNKFVKEIFSLLLSIFIFERNILKSQVPQSNNINKNEVILLSNQFLIDLKNLFSYYDKIYSLLEKLNIPNNYAIDDIFKKISEVEENENILKLISNKKHEFEKNKDKEYFIFEKKSYITTTTPQRNLSYPDKFCILDENIYSKINKLLNINIESKEEIKFELYFNHGRICLKPNSNNKNNNLYYILIYSLSNNNSKKEIEYIPEIILSFDNLVVFKSFDEMIKNENIFEICSKNKSDFESKYKCKSYLINKDDIKESNKNENKELNTNNKKENKYLFYLIILYSEYQKFKNEINEKFNSQSNKPEEEYYLINRKYMNELENILHFQETIKENEIGEIKTLDLDFKNNNNTNNDLINKIRGNLKEKVINNLIKLDDDKLIINNGNKYDLFQIAIKDTNFKYYNNCQIINKKIYLLLNHIDKDISKITKSIKCILNNKKIITFDKEKIINIGHLNEDNTFIIEHIIYYESSEKISKIFEVFKKKDYALIEKSISDKRIKITYNNILFEAKIHSLLEEKEANQNRKELSPKIKVLILLSLFKNKKINYQKDNNKGKVFLMNKEWLLQYQYDKINKLIEDNGKLKNYLDKEKISNLSIDSNQMNTIISSLDYDSLLKIDDNISKLENNNNIPCQAIKELLTLENNTNIFIYTNFVMINEEISEMLGNYFNDFKGEYNYYYSHMDGDIIIVYKYALYSILFGKINYTDNSFDIKYIFNFFSNYKLDIEKKNLMTVRIEEYIKNKTLFNGNNDSNIVSPIYDNYDIIGNCYKYYSNVKYPNNINKINCKNENLIKAIDFYFYFQKLSKKIKEAKGEEKEYYLINNNLMSDIKINYNYKKIKEKLDNINFIDNQYKTFLAIKNLSNDIIKYFTDNKEIKNKFEKEYMEPDIIPINDYKTGKSYYIYDKFYLLEREKAQDLINGIYISYGFGMIGKYSDEINYLKCIINEGKIIIQYPQNFNGNDNTKYISAIGELNYENQFLSEYVLIYEDYASQNNHINSIKRNINKYLTSLQFFQNSAQIIKNNYKEFGTIIKYCNETCTYNSNDMNENEIKNDKDNNPGNETSNQESQNPLKKDENNDNLYKKEPGKESTNNDSEYNLDYQTDSHEIRVNFIYPPKIGLQNIGATCYMNATLQCFCHIEKFVNYFKYSKNVISKVRNNKNDLTSSFKLLIENLWPNNYNESYPKKYYAPEEFKNKISKMNPLFEGIAANDAKDLVNFIIMTLHQELNKAKKSDNNNNNINLDQRNQQIMFNNFAQNFSRENQSIISDLFYGINCNMTQCCNCNTNIYNYQIYFFLVFPLEEVRKFKNNNQMNFINQPVNIYDCFNYDRKVNLMFGENSMYCNYCKQNSNCKMCTCLTTGPEILILLLNRGQGIEFKVKINFMEDLDLSNYIQYKNTGVKYKLIGVITHIGESGMGGHFIAYCKDPISQSWYKYNDAIVSDVQEQDFQKEVINFAMPYLLFYQKYS